MKENNREMNLTKEEKRRALEAPFWDENAKVDKNTPLMKKIDKLCKDIFK